MHVKKILALMGFTLSFSANSAIIDLGSITQDTSTNLDWLDVTLTRSLSYNEVFAEMGVGGKYEGWRYATVDELNRLIENFGYPSGGADDDLIELMIHTLGDTSDAYYDSTDFYVDVAPDGAGGTWGILADINSAAGGAHWYARISDDEYIWRSSGEPKSDNPDRVDTRYSYLLPNSYGIDLGSFLVAASGTAVTPVPLPSVVWLFGLALAGMIGVKRKK